MAFRTFNWTCKYCGKPTTITEPHFDDNRFPIYIRNSDLGYICVLYYAISCPDQKCKKLHFTVQIHEAKSINTEPYFRPTGEPIHSWSLLPEAGGKPQPDYIPKQIRNDYIEACCIRDLSPKASATLSRRCLQGIIRDFHGIKKNTLKREIDELEGKVDSITWTAIDAVRKIGNIGAHMEKDIDLIVDVDPDEAQLLIGLIETLFREWYVEKHEREQRMQGLISLAEKKDHEKKGGSQPEESEAEK